MPDRQMKELLIGPIEAVIWDLDDTLIVERPAAETAMTTTCQHATTPLMPRSQNSDMAIEVD